MGQGALSKPIVQWWLSLNSSTNSRPSRHQLLLAIPAHGAQAALSLGT